MQTFSFPWRSGAGFILMALLSSALGCAPTYANRVPPSLALTTRPPRYGIADLAAEVHRRINQARQEHGLRALVWNARLLPIATAHSRDMARRGYFAHTSPDGVTPAGRYRRGGFRCRVPSGPGRLRIAGENLILVHRIRAWQISPNGRKTPYQYFTLAGMADRMVTGWLNSPAHREAMLIPDWRTQAIGIFISADGRVWATENFC